MEKIKQFLSSEQGKDLLIVIIVILVGLSSFELGRLSKGNTNTGVKIEYPAQMEIQTANAVSSIKSLNIPGTNKNSVGKTFFASNRGHKYYSIGCSAGKSIKMENRVYFSTREEAEGAGYELSSSCK